MKQAAAIVFSAKNIKAFFDIYQLGITRDLEKQESILLSIEQSESALATEEIRHRLNRPEPWEKDRLLRALFAYPRPELAEAVLEEAADPWNSNRGAALFALGHYPGQKTISLLEKVLNEENSLFLSVAAKSLGRLKHFPVLEKVRKLAKGETVPEFRINYFIAQSHLDKKGFFLKTIFLEAHPRTGTRFSQTIFWIGTFSFHADPSLADFFYLQNGQPKAGLYAFLLEARANNLFLNAENALREHIEEGDFRGIWTFCDSLWKAPQAESQKRFIQKGMVWFFKEARPGNKDFNETNTLAALFYTFYLV